MTEQMRDDIKNLSKKLHNKSEFIRFKERIS